jgi:hypothetical protein
MFEFVHNKIKYVVFFVIAACAPAPASLPWVRIDRSLQGAVVSREAAEAWVAQRKRDDGKHAKELEDEKERTRTAQVLKDSAVWWRDNGPMVGAGGTVLGIIIGVVLGSQIRWR